MLLYPLCALLYGTGKCCSSFRIFLSQLACYESIAAVFVLVGGIGSGVDECGQAILLLSNSGLRVTEHDGINSLVLQRLCKVVAGECRCPQH